MWTTQCAQLAKPTLTLFNTQYCTTRPTQPTPIIATSCARPAAPNFTTTMLPIACHVCRPAYTALPSSLVSTACSPSTSKPQWPHASLATKPVGLAETAVRLAVSLASMATISTLLLGFARK